MVGSYWIRRVAGLWGLRLGASSVLIEVSTWGCRQRCSVVGSSVQISKGSSGLRPDWFCCLYDKEKGNGASGSWCNTAKSKLGPSDSNLVSHGRLTSYIV